MSTPASPAARPGPVLVTGAAGLVGGAVVAHLLERGADVVATDLDTPAGCRWAARAPRLVGGGAGTLEIAWCDLTDAAAVRTLVARHRPRAVVHLAALIPPACYRVPALARRVNVDAVAHLGAALEAESPATRLVLASSVAVHGARNPHRPDRGLLGPDTPVAPSDLYGRTKAAAEEVVRGLDVPWAILRLGGVMTTAVGGADADSTDFGAMIPDDQPIQTVDVRDVARAFAAAVDLAEDAVAGRTFMIGGDDSHRLRQGDIGTGITGALGMEGALPPGRPGDPDDDAAWFATDWMDTASAQEVLDFQRITWPGLLDEIRAATGRRRHLLRLAAPVVGAMVARRPARRRIAARAVADPWGDVAAVFGDPDPAD